MTLATHRAVLAADWASAALRGRPAVDAVCDRYAVYGGTKWSRLLAYAMVRLAVEGDPELAAVVDGYELAVDGPVEAGRLRRLELEADRVFERRRNGPSILDAASRSLAVETACRDRPEDCLAETSFRLGQRAGLLGSARRPPLPAAVWRTVYSEATLDEYIRQGRLFAAVMGYAGPPVGPHRTESVVALATAIYAERAWDRYPILADALQDAGYPDTQVLDELRSDFDGIRCRGYAVLRTILWKPTSRLQRSPYDEP